MTFKFFHRALPLAAAFLGGLLLFLGAALLPSSGGARTERAAVSGTEDPVQEGFGYIQEARDEADPTAYGKARSAFRTALREDPASFGATLGEAVLAGSTHDFALQVELARRAVALDPFDATARGVLGDGLLELGRTDAAERAYQEMIDLRPDLAGYARVAGLFQSQGKTGRALDAMRLSLEASPTPRDRAWALSQIGELHISDGDLGAAQRAFERAQGHDPDYFLPDVGRAHVAFARADLDRAISLQTSVVERYPAAVMVAELGDMLWVAGREAEADAAYKRSDALTQKLLENGVLVDVEMPLFYADDKRDPQRALEMAERLFGSRATPTTTDALAWASWANGDLERAERLISGLLQDANAGPHVWYHAGVIAADQGRDAVAIKRLRHALAEGDYWAFRYPVEAKRVLEELTS